MGVIVSSSPVSAANCFDECRAVAASQRMNSVCVGEREAGARMPVFHGKIICNLEP